MATEGQAAQLLEDQDQNPARFSWSGWNVPSVLLFVCVLVGVGLRVPVNGLGSLAWITTLMAINIIRRPFEEEQQRNTIAEKFEVTTEKVLLFGVFLGMYLIPAIFLLTGFPRVADYDGLGAWSTIVSIAVTLPALYLFWRSHVDLGRNWSVTTELRENHTLTTTGVYSKVRHPMYTSLFLISLVQPLLIHNWIAGFTPLCSFTILYVIRVGYEEDMMVKHFGDEYRQYCSKTGRLLPCF